MSEASSLIPVVVDGEHREVEPEVTGVQLFESDKNIIAVRINGQPRDLYTPLHAGDTVESIALDSEDGLAIMRHSATHVMAQAVQEIYPDAKLGIGPVIEDGFYYDFGVEHPFTPDDIKKIEKHMQRIVKSSQSFRRRTVTEAQAREEEAGQPYKLELIEAAEDAISSGEDTAVSQGELSMYDNVDRDGNVVWTDLCHGPHLPNTRYIKAFKLQRAAAAYWRGDEKNPMLQRIYGTAWASKEDMKAYLQRLEEAAKRDHRKLGAEMDLFSFPDEIGPGLAVFHPKGAAIINAMKEYSRIQHRKNHYSFVQTPHITKGGLYETSGHLQWYRDGMY
ncbi:MAG: threonine--tRNA ligase, partial [Scardovia wiggsiae]|nr:threonine--tRNA ligase [Scardovia wiggsiae]